MKKGRWNSTTTAPSPFLFLICSLPLSPPPALPPSLSPLPPPLCLQQIASATIAFRELVRLHTELFVDHCRACRGSGRLTCPHCAGTASVRTRPAEPSLRAMSLVTRAPTDVVVCARCGPPSPFDEDPGLAAELDEIVARADEAAEGKGDDLDLAALDDELDVRRYGEEIRQNIAAALLGKRLLPKETPFLAGTVPCDECGGNPRVARHTPNPQVFLQLEQSFQTDASLRAGDFHWPQRAGFPRAFLGLGEDEEEAREEEEERERARLFSGRGQPLVFPDRKGKAPLRMGASAAAAAEKAALRRGRRTFGEAPSRPRMDFFWRDMLAGARASPWNAAARVRGGGGEDGPGGWTSSDSESDDDGARAAAAAGGEEEEDDQDEEEPELDEDGNPVPKNKKSKKKKLTRDQRRERKRLELNLSKEEQDEWDARERERRRHRVRRDPPPLTMSELFGDELTNEFGLAFEDPEAAGEGEKQRDDEGGAEEKSGGGGGERANDDDEDDNGVGGGASDDDDGAGGGYSDGD